MRQNFVISECANSSRIRCLAHNLFQHLQGGYTFCNNKIIFVDFYILPIRAYTKKVDWPKNNSIFKKTKKVPWNFLCTTTCLLQQQQICNLIILQKITCTEKRTETTKGNSDFSTIVPYTFKSRANRLTLSKIPNELKLCDQVKNGHTAKKVTL